MAESIVGLPLFLPGEWRVVWQQKTATTTTVGRLRFGSPVLVVGHEDSTSTCDYSHDVVKENPNASSDAGQVVTPLKLRSSFGGNGGLPLM